MKLLAIDPGNKTGWAVYDTDHDPVITEFGLAKPISDFYELLISGKFNDVDLVVSEDYKIRPADLNKGWSHEWNNGPALQVLGAIDFWAQEYSIKTARQQASIKPAGYGYIGMTYKKGKPDMDMYDAIAHGAYYLVKNKIVKIQDLRLANQ